ncbi:MAG TPA: hypothetical protein VKB39_10360, partial [Candidatus Baltobacteraceae bacterium]|nr:hypothetical protein [Candidatus Baltobacteraceae bacterium]
REQAQKAHKPIAGKGPPDNPDDSVGSYSHDFTSLYYVDNALQNLQGAVESADVAPTPAMQSAYRKLEAIAKRALAQAR